MNDRGITRDVLLQSFPLALQGDPGLTALGAAAAELLVGRLAEIDRLRIYPNIDALPESLLDLLAYDFKVDWWDPELSLTEKRRILKDSWNVHRRLGTAWAVKQSLAASLPSATVQEWFEYGGTPYCFKIDCALSDFGLTAEKQRRVMGKVWYYKDLRSHLEGFTIHWENSGTVHLAACAESRQRVEVWPRLARKLESGETLAVSSAGETRQRVEVWPKLPTTLESAGTQGLSAVGKTRQSVEVWPKLTRKLESSAELCTTVLTRSRLSVDIYPRE